jgi:hypothetical protein
LAAAVDQLTPIPNWHVNGSSFRNQSFDYNKPPSSTRSKNGRSQPINASSKADVKSGSGPIAVIGASCCFLFAARSIALVAYDVELAAPGARRPFGFGDARGGADAARQSCAWFLQTDPTGHFSSISHVRIMLRVFGWAKAATVTGMIGDPTKAKQERN